MRQVDSAGDRLIEAKITTRCTVRGLAVPLTTTGRTSHAPQHQALGRAVVWRAQQAEDAQKDVISQVAQLGPACYGLDARHVALIACRNRRAVQCCFLWLAGVDEASGGGCPAAAATQQCSCCPSSLCRAAAAALGILD